MGDHTNIAWTRTQHPDGTVTRGASWNPVSGCTKLTSECKFCYVERDWHRLTHLPAYEGRAFTDVACHEERLDQPLRWQRGRRIFVCSTSDLFHAAVPDAFLDRIFAVISLCPQHTFLILTKRADRMQRYLSAPGRREAIAAATEGMACPNPVDWVRADGADDIERGGDPLENVEWLPRWPLPNVHAGVTAGTQESADERIPLLLQTPAVLHWVSAEPLLGRMDLSRWMVKELPVTDNAVDAPDGAMVDGMERVGDRWLRRVGLDWVVPGGESGTMKTARPMLPEWAEDLRGQCEEAGVPFFFKQQGVWVEGFGGSEDRSDQADAGCFVNFFDGKVHQGGSQEAFREGDTFMRFVGRKLAGDQLNGRHYTELPA